MPKYKTGRKTIMETNIMGLAASQARFLGLTARKTNTEYEGQQVNQERTALANQSAGLYGKMLALSVPTPPDATDYYNMRYTFSYGGEKYEILSFGANAGGTYDVKVSRTYDTTKAFSKDVNNVTLNKDATGAYTINVGSSNTALTEVTKENLANELKLSNSKFYSYQYNDTTYYISDDNMKSYMNNGDSYTGAISEYYYGTTSVTSDPETLKDVTMTVNSSGSFTGISIDGTNVTLDSSNVQDDSGYEEAMNNYELSKNLYDRAIADINAQTEIIQQQDKVLELRLKQLDTEQSALQTELEAVSKVIEKNVESTFKTFA